MYNLIQAISSFLEAYGEPELATAVLNSLTSENKGTEPQSPSCPPQTDLEFIYRYFTLSGGERILGQLQRNQYQVNQSLNHSLRILPANFGQNPCCSKNLLEYISLKSIDGFLDNLGLIPVTSERFYMNSCPHRQFDHLYTKRSFPSHDKLSQLADGSPPHIAFLRSSVPFLDMLSEKPGFARDAAASTSLSLLSRDDYAIANVTGMQTNQNFTDAVGSRNVSTETLLKQFVQTKKTVIGLLAERIKGLTVESLHSKVQMMLEPMAWNIRRHKHSQTCLTFTFWWSQKWFQFVSGTQIQRQRLPLPNTFTVHALPMMSDADHQSKGMFSVRRTSRRNIFTMKRVPTSSLFSITPNTHVHANNAGSAGLSEAIPCTFFQSSPGKSSEQPFFTLANKASPSIDEAAQPLLPKHKSAMHDSKETLVPLPPLTFYASDALLCDMKTQKVVLATSQGALQNLPDSGVTLPFVSVNSPHTPPLRQSTPSVKVSPRPICVGVPKASPSCNMDGPAAPTSLYESIQSNSATNEQASHYESLLIEQEANIRDRVQTLLSNEPSDTTCFLEEKPAYVTGRDGKDLLLHPVECNGCSSNQDSFQQNPVSATTRSIAELIRSLQSSLRVSANMSESAAKYSANNAIPGTSAEPDGISEQFESDDSSVRSSESSVAALQDITKHIATAIRLHNTERLTSNIRRDTMCDVGLPPYKCYEKSYTDHAASEAIVECSDVSLYTQIGNVPGISSLAVSVDSNTGECTVSATVPKLPIQAYCDIQRTLDSSCSFLSVRDVSTSAQERYKHIRQVISGEAPRSSLSGKTESWQLPIHFTMLTTCSEAHGLHSNHTERGADVPFRIKEVILDRYVLHNLIGVATFSNCFSCLDQQDGKMYCLKIVKSGKEYFDQSLDEIAILSLLKAFDPQHAFRCVRFHEAFYYREHLLLKFDLLGQDLYTHFNTRTKMKRPNDYTLAVVRDIARQALQALDFIHRLGLIHLDIKPENIVHTDSQWGGSKPVDINIVDFGTCSFVYDKMHSYIQSRSYRAPEIILGCSYDGRADIWSLGAVLAELLTGHVLFPNHSVGTILGRICALIGPVPQNMILSGKTGHKYLTMGMIPYEEADSKCSNAKDVFISQQQGLLEFWLFGQRCADLSEEEALFSDLLRQMLTIDSARRPTASMLMSHPFLHC